MTADILLDLCAPIPPATDAAEARRGTVAVIFDELFGAGDPAWVAEWLGDDDEYD
jgi:hypothetical protein